MKLAVVGLGFMGSTHLKAIRNIEDIELVAVCSQHQKSLSGDFSETHGNLGGPGEKMDFSQVKKFSDIEPLLADPEIDAVDLCLPTDLHAAVAIEAMRRGKHVLVEKPMALDGDTADQMVAASIRYDRVLMTAQVLRFIPSYVALRDALAREQLGKVRSAIFRRRCAAPMWGAGWLQDATRSGGGVFDLLIHDVDMMLHLFGAPAAVQATGFEDALKGIDIIHAEFFYDHGGAVLITGGWHHPRAYPFSMEYTVVADGGTVEYSSAGRNPTLYSADGTERILPLEDVDGYAAEIRYFSECCRKRVKPDLCPATESADAVRLTRLMIEARNHNGERIECNISSRWKSA